MICEAVIATKKYQFDSGKGRSLAIQVNFNGDQPNTYGVAPATANVWREGDFVGDTRAGGGCNFEQYKMVPHCNGTHTECIGHITHKRISIADCLTTDLMPATLITVTPAKAELGNESYTPALNPNDLVITKSILQKALTNQKTGFSKALIIRTLPNDESKKSRDYMTVPPAFFTQEAMQFIVDQSFVHLLIDLPSVDRLFDDGRLSTHHIFWQIPQGYHTLTPESRIDSTITEMIFVSDKIEDGNYLLSIQIPSFKADAAPSRPILYPLTSIS